VNHQDKIEQLISDTSDPVVRATLLVLSSIDHGLEKHERALDSNTVATQAIADAFTTHRNDFTSHIIDEQKILSGVRWAWWAATGMSVCIMLLGAYIFSMLIRGIENDSAQIKSNTQRLTTLETKVSDLERRQIIDESRWQK
jgi:hypothetical protein